MKILIVIMLAVSTSAISSVECQKIVVGDSQQEYSVKASIIKGLHVVFYDNIKLALVSNDVLWKSVTDDDFKKHFWLFPKNIVESDKNSVGITFILDDDRNVQLVVSMDINASSCLMVSNKYNNEVVHKFSSQKAAVSPSLQQEILSDSISSNYKYDTTYVRSVYDDGIFTYVSIDNKVNNAFSVSSLINGELSVISNLKYIRRTNTYRIAGIHKLLKFTDGVNSFNVELK